MEQSTDQPSTERTTGSDRPRSHSRRGILLAAGAVAAGVVTAPSPALARGGPTTPRPTSHPLDDTGAVTTSTGRFVDYREWTDVREFARGRLDGLRPARGGVDGQGDDDATVYTDTFATRDGKAVGGYQLRVSLLAPEGSHAGPWLARIGVMSSFLPDEPTVDAGAYPLRCQLLVDCPQFSPNIHEGEYPEYDGGGEAWCSPTSTSMVVYQWGKRVCRPLILAG